MTEGVPLRDYVEARLKDMDLRNQQRFEATEMRLTSMNEFRGTVSDVIGKCITRSEALALVVASCAVTTAIISAINFFTKK